MVNSVAGVISISIMTSIAPVFRNNIETQLRCVRNQYSVGRSIVGKGIRHMTSVDAQIRVVGLI